MHVTQHGKTALHEALSSTGNMQIVTSLLLHGADPNTAPKVSLLYPCRVPVMKTDSCNVMYFCMLVCSVGRFSPHGITMPKGLYFTALVHSFFYFRRPISEVTERISTKLWHIFTFDCYSKNLVRTFPGIYPSPRSGGETAFLGPTLNFDRTYLCNRTWYR